MILIIVLHRQAWWLNEDDDDDDDNNNNNNNNRLTHTESNTDKTANPVHVINFFIKIISFCTKLLGFRIIKYLQN
jgi:hypothetical protein